MAVLARAVNGGPIKRHRGIPQAFLLSYGEHVGAAKEVERVRKVDESDDKHVGHNSDVRVGHALRDPDCTGGGGVRHDVEDKRLVAIVHLAASHSDNPCLWFVA